jgi:[CysO sulfur-carrier protein]-S-L-cysteine hydrolase
MLNLILPPDISGRIKTALEKAGRREVGGVLLAEHVGSDEFAVRESPSIGWAHDRPT